MITDVKENGKTYTPSWVAKVILDGIGYTKDIRYKAIIEPSCGDGQIMEEIVRRYISDLPKGLTLEQKRDLIFTHLHGWDIDSEAIEKCRQRLDAVAREYGLVSVKWNLRIIDSIILANIQALAEQFYFCVGNPPYIRIQHLGEERRKAVQSQWKLTKVGAADMYLAFFEIGLYLLRPDGKLGYITSNSYFKTKAGLLLRKHLKDNKLVASITDFGYSQVFKDATTYTAITILDKKTKATEFAFSEGDGETEKITYKRKISLAALDDSNWTFCSDEDRIRLETLTQGTPLGKLARISTGLATLANNIYIFKPTLSIINGCVMLTRNGKVFPIEESILKAAVKASTVKRSNEDQGLKIIFPYKKNKDGKHTIIPEKELEKDYPNVYTYFKEMRSELDRRDKGKPNPVAWYAFGRTQGLDSTFGPKILTAPMNLKPVFVVREQRNETYFDGYGIVPNHQKIKLERLAELLNTDRMKTFVNATSRSYSGGYKSYAKGFITNFGIDEEKL